MDITKLTLDMFLRHQGADLSEMHQFSSWIETQKTQQCYIFESAHRNAQRPECLVQTHDGIDRKLINLASYNYLGYANHPEVIAAAKDALDTYGLGATGSPILNGTFSIHKELEQRLVQFWGKKEFDVALFSSGYGTNVGVISALMHEGDHVVLDRYAHASLWDGAILSRAKTWAFRHNDLEHLESILKNIADCGRRILVCCEGVYSADGDYGRLSSIVALAKRYNALVLVDEAHSLLVGGPTGRGICEEQNVLDSVDIVIATFSKAFGAVGGCVWARKEIVTYLRYYSRARMFSCSLDPSSTAGILKTVNLADTADGETRRRRLLNNAKRLRELLHNDVNTGSSDSWIIPIIYGKEELTIPVGNYMQKHGLDVSLMMFPAVPKNQARIRLFVTSEHTDELLEKTAEIIRGAARFFNITSKGNGNE